MKEVYTMCPNCGDKHSITLTDEQFNRAIEYMKLRPQPLIQDYFPDLDADQREFFLTGICPECWALMEDKDDSDIDE